MDQYIIVTQAEASAQNLEIYQYSLSRIFCVVRITSEYTGPGLIYTFEQLQPILQTIEWTPFTPKL